MRILTLFLTTLAVGTANAVIDYLRRKYLVVRGKMKRKKKGK